MLAFMILVPKPCELGAVTGGPPASSQLKVKTPRASDQRTASLPSGTDSAPYFAELVAS